MFATPAGARSDLALQPPLTRSAMPAGQSLGLRHYNQVIESEIIVQFGPLLGNQTGFFLLGDEIPDTLTSFLGGRETRQCLRGDLLDQKIENLVAQIHMADYSAEKGRRASPMTRA